jgi:hypothetical protein
MDGGEVGESLRRCILNIVLPLPAAGLTFVSTKVSKTMCGTKLAIHGSNSCATASLQKQGGGIVSKEGFTSSIPP